MCDKTDDNWDCINTTSNVMYKEIFQNVWTTVVCPKILIMLNCFLIYIIDHCNIWTSPLFMTRAVARVKVLVNIYANMYANWIFSSFFFFFLSCFLCVISPWNLFTLIVYIRNPSHLFYLIVRLMTHDKLERKKLFTIELELYQLCSQWNQIEHEWMIFILLFRLQFCH